MSRRLRLDLWPSVCALVGSLLVLIGVWLPCWPCFGVGIALELAGIVPLAVRRRRRGGSNPPAQPAPATSDLAVRKYRIVLVDAGRRKLPVIRCLRRLYGLNIETASSMVQHTPSTISTTDSLQVADAAVDELTKRGATATVERNEG